MSRARTVNSLPFLIGALLISFATHAGLIGYASLHKRVEPVAQKPIEMEIVNTPPPPPPPPPEEKKEEPKPEKIKPPIKVAETVKPKVIEPPPPNEEAPKEPPKPVPLVVGISMSSTVGSGAFVAAVGNTVYGKTEKKAVNPADVKAYSAPNYVPPGSADTEPVVSHEEKVRYPEEAKNAGIEGTVRLRIVIDNEGRVVDAKIISGPGYGLNEAALAAIKLFKFDPAIKGGQPVSTTILYPYIFELY